MKLPTMAFSIAKLVELSPTREIGVTGQTHSRTASVGDLRLRLVEYGPGYLADHWCDRGHVFYLLSGEVTVELQDGRAFASRRVRAFRFPTMAMQLIGCALNQAELHLS